MSFLNKILLGVKSSTLTLYYFLSTFYSKSNVLTKNDTCLVISLTCYPGRIGTLFLTLESLIQQNLSNIKIVVYLSKDEFPDEQIPYLLRKQCNRGVEIKFVSDNLRSYKKLHYAISDYPDLPILTADDDILYPRDWAKKFYEYFLKNNETILYARGHKILLDEEGKPKPYSTFTKPEAQKADNLVIPTGVSGILYPPHCFYKDVRNADIFMRLAPRADDLWYRLMTLMNNRKCMLIYNNSVHFPPILGTQKTSLRMTNLKPNDINNDSQLRALLDYYKINLESYN